jgi:hypothetical protein
MKYHVIHGAWNDSDSRTVNDMPSDPTGDAMPLDPAKCNLRPNTKFRHNLYQEFNMVDWTSSSVNQMDVGRGNK